MPAQLISFLVGLLSLSAETLWVRTYAFANQSTPIAIAVVLSVYLLGIARGASVGGGFCRTPANLREIVAKCVLAGSAVIALTPAFILALPRAPLLLLPLIFAPAFLLSICFPICHHLGTKLGTGHVGKSLSRVYAANILGSVIGPLVTNFVVLEWVTTQMAFIILGAIGMCIAVAIALADRLNSSIKQMVLAGTALAFGLTFVFGAGQASAGAQNQLIAKLSARGGEIRHVVETRQGIVVTYKDDVAGDAVFGGNVYDGRTNIDPRINSNGLNRVIMLQAITPTPRRVLMIGLSVGSWQYIIGGFPDVERMDVVEINPGYIDLARNYDAQNKAIRDPRVNLIIGDGRKFLRQNPDAKYDLVIMNTTWHWRMYVSLLMSREFLSLIKSHMTPEAVLAFNTTESIDALKTAAAVFPHVYRYDNFAVASETDWRVKLADKAAGEKLRLIAPAGKPLFGPRDGDVVADFLDGSHVQTLDEAEIKIGRSGEIITDRNLITEYRYGRR
jgi:spermidine synthase